MTRASQSFENVPASDQKTQGAASREILDKVVAGLLTFKPEMLVSSRSRYDDPKWDFGRSTNARVFVTTGSKFVIPWGRWQMRFCLPDGMVADMKRFAFLRLNCSIGLLDTSTEPSVLTLVREIRILFAFMGTICESLTTARVCLI